MDKPDDVLERWLKQDGRTTHHIDIRLDGRVAVWSRYPPLETAGSDCSWQEFADGTLQSLAMQVLDQAAHQEALAYVRNLLLS